MVMEHYAKYYAVSQNMKAQRQQEINGEYGRNGILQEGLPFIMTAPRFQAQRHTFCCNIN